ncbi:unnamed protein product, partial [Pylaiella littoralis]
RQVPRELTSGTTGPTRVRGGSRTSGSRKRETYQRHVDGKGRGTRLRGRPWPKEGELMAGINERRGTGGHKGSGVAGLELHSTRRSSPNSPKPSYGWKTCRAEISERWCSCCQRCGAETTG